MPVPGPECSSQTAPRLHNDGGVAAEATTTPLPAQVSWSTAGCAGLHAVHACRTAESTGLVADFHTLRSRLQVLKAASGTLNSCPKLCVSNSRCVVCVISCFVWTCCRRALLAAGCLPSLNRGTDVQDHQHADTLHVHCSAAETSSDEVEA